LSFFAMEFSPLSWRFYSSFAERPFWGELPDEVGIFSYVLLGSCRTISDGVFGAVPPFPVRALSGSFPDRPVVARPLSCAYLHDVPSHFLRRILRA